MYNVVGSHLCIEIKVNSHESLLRCHRKSQRLGNQAAKSFKAYCSPPSKKRQKSAIIFLMRYIFFLISEILVKYLFKSLKIFLDSFVGLSYVT